MGPGMGRAGQMGAVDVEGGVADETVVVAGVPAPQVEVPGNEVGLRKPSEVVRGHSWLGWSR